MNKSISLGLIDNSEVNYITFKLNNLRELELFCDDLAIYIINKYTDYFIKYIINKNYGYFNDFDKYEVYKESKNTFSKICSEILTMRKNYIKKKIYSYFSDEEAENIILEGFVKFRIEKYIEEIEFAVDSAVDKFFINQEYNRFIKMLQELISIEKPAMRVIHVSQDYSKRYILCDENFEELSKSCVSEALQQGYQYEYINQDDLLLSILIELAPKKIVIHNLDNFENKELVQTILKVFETRISVCKGCNLCNP